MFAPWTAHIFNFWVVMLVATTLLTTLSLVSGKADLKRVYNFKPSHILVGLISAAVLYLVFFAGNYFSHLLFDFSKQQITNIYATKEQADKILIGLALLLWIGPSEEIFWRGFAQDRLMKKYGDINGFIITTIVYAFVHIWAFNFMLFMAALICGIFWGWMYMKYKSVIPGIISHAVWDAVIFVVIPISQ
jgi:membrane protease YdiL (CAAX protease family)